MCWINVMCTTRRENDIKIKSIELRVRIKDMLEKRHAHDAEEKRHQDKEYRTKGEN